MYPRECPSIDPQRNFLLSSFLASTSLLLFLSSPFFSFHPNRETPTHRDIERMGNPHFSSFHLIFFTFLLHAFIHRGFSNPENQNPSRETLEIIIGGGGPPAPSPENPDCPPPAPPPEPECPPPPPPPEPECPPPPPPPKPHRPATVHYPPPRPPTQVPPFGGFENELLQRVSPVIERFRRRIVDDPTGLTQNWHGKDICSYNGLKCDFLPGTKKRALASIDFNRRRLAGGHDFSLNGFIEKLPELAIFHANSNNFTGTIPKSTSKLKYFYELDLSNNKLSGEFPAELLNSRLLTFLDLRFNSFSGCVPPEIFNIDLDVFFINNNKFIQTLPENLGSSRALYFTFANNNFTGPIPRSIGKAPFLLEILFLNNQLSGCLPYEIGFLVNSTVFDAGRNFLTGPIPLSFGCLQKMEILNFAGNMLYGAVPEIVCKLPNLRNLSLSENFFTQVGPECRKLINKKVLDVRKNCILGIPDQKSPYECAVFFSKRQLCENPESMKWIPCRKDGYVTPLETSEKRGDSPAPSPMIYRTLAPGRS
ncbi:uncharacterized protein At4g06744-like [Carica papaya]|uniref:uncharacterized protein At4g06744-like n=1 Tax=Carica papaya TaxID=3649 RepID=UPI000B8C6F7C|nr:uncharacterized protein At4g06744-like [Carica papaya]